MGKRDLAFTEPLSGPGPDQGGEDSEYMYYPASASPRPPLLDKFTLTQGMAQVYSLTPPGLPWDPSPLASLSGAPASLSTQWRLL